ncbi:hypothetical protein FRC06_008862 [Ceratobasidium sp. 370]|nr:hypothetical protein FRC06_008862 [Ceratobasidium sp. 370]
MRPVSSSLGQICLSACAVRMEIQLPSWLALEEMGVDGTFMNWDQTGKQTRFRVNHHRDIFSDYKGTTFNSLAIESQFSNLQRIGVSDIFVYINDDVFFSHDLNARDFHMGGESQSIYTLGLRLTHHDRARHSHAHAKLHHDLSQPRHPQHDGLEWESLQYSNWLLSNRFGSRYRPYPTHLAKTLSISMLQEVANAWPDEITLAASRAFRGMKHTQKGETTADAYMVFLEHHWVVERWREVLLWSWVVARGWDREELGGSFEQTTLEVRRSHRSTLDNAHEWAGAKSTSSVLSSLGGYPYSEAMGEQGWVSERDVCEIELERCFGAHESASRTFQRIAFEEPAACGDCIIRALVNRSGKRGLAAFLPSVPSGDPNPSATTPTLPVSAKWQDTDFRLSSVLKPTSLDRTNVRGAVLRMLQRYRFIIGETPFMFAIVTDPQSAEQNV